MAATLDSYLAVLKASYDYEPQPDAEDELAIKEDQLLFLLEKTDDDWWKVKIKSESQDEEGPAGMVPSAYVEPAQPISTVKALYEYQANADGELSLEEDEVLHLYAKDEDWFLVQSQKEDGKIGYIPGNYVEETDAEGEANQASTAASPPAFDLTKLVVPDSPPKPAYTDPTELVSRSKAKAHGGPVETWSISEVDKKGKKKKGTLGVGNGSLFFASESDKTPVQKWQASDIQSTRVEKSKHVHIELSGPNAAELHFHTGSKEVAEAIIAKLQEARTDAKLAEQEATALVPAALPERPRSSAAKSVHFDDSDPEIIPDQGEDDKEGSVVEEEPEEPQDTLGAGERAVVLYDFAADGEDEMTVHEGETLLVLERDADEWWKCRNAQGDEGVVPANYLELVPGSGGPQASVAMEDDKAAREAKEAAAQAEADRRAREEEERAEKERKRAEAEQRAKASAAAAEADRRKREQEREKQREKEREREVRAAAEERQKQKQKRDSSSDGGSSARPPKANGESSRASSDRRRPDPENTRVWHDRTGQFRVEAAFLGFANGKLRLHKSNGVIIEVPSAKMSAEDMAYVEKLTAKQKAASPRRTSDDEPLSERRISLQPQPRPTSQPPKKGPSIDWFEFFLNAGCDVDDCSRYAQSFDRDKIDEALLPDITESTMRSLGLREGDIIRVKKHIDHKYTKNKPAASAVDKHAEQLRRDEELAKQLQAEENSGTTRGQAPNLFAGPNGQLKNNVRRGRPQPSKSLPPASIDMDSISTLSDQIQRSVTPLVSSPVRTGGTPTPGPAKTASPAPAVGEGFDDDAWTNRPSSTKPTPPPAAAPARATSVSPAPAPPAPPPAAAVASPPPAAQSTSPPSLANTTESDVFNQLARLAAIRTQSPAVVSRPMSTPTVVSPPPTGYHSGLGVGSSPSPMSQHLQAQQTGALPPPAFNGPRGPLAPIPVNQSLLQPLVPTPTGYGNGFVPTRQGSASLPFQPSPSPSFLTSQPTGFGGIPQQLGPQPTGFQPQQQSLGPQPTGFQPSPTGFQPSGFQPQPTGFQPQPTGFQPQPTGFQPQGPLLSQPTGLPAGSFGNGMGGQINGLPQFQNNTSFSPIQSNPTGFNPTFGQISSPAPQSQSQSTNTNPANVFAQMKSGTFGSENGSAPQSAAQYDALRPQTTGWVGGYQAQTGYGGYGYQ